MHCSGRLRDNSYAHIADHPGSKAKFHYAIQAGIRPAGQLDSVMEFDLSGAIQLTSSSRAGRRPAANRSATRFELSRHVERTNTKILSSHFFAISILNPNYDVINDVIMSDADCTPGREPRRVAAS